MFRSTGDEARVDASPGRGAGDRSRRKTSGAAMTSNPSIMRNALSFVAGLSGILVSATVAAIRIDAQTPPPSPQFEVASIKPNKSGPGPQRIGFQPGGRFVATNIPVRDLISIAYGQPQPLP